MEQGSGMTCFRMLSFDHRWSLAIQTRWVIATLRFRLEPLAAEQDLWWDEMVPVLKPLGPSAVWSVWMKYEEEWSNVKNMKNMKRLVISRHSASPQDPQVPFTTSKPLKIPKALYMVPDHCHDTGGVIADCIMKGYIDLPHYSSHFAVLSRARRPFYAILYIYINLYIQYFSA